MPHFRQLARVIVSKIRRAAKVEVASMARIVLGFWSDWAELAVGRMEIETMSFFEHKAVSPFRTGAP
jgi:hypothetical protein